MAKENKNKKVWLIIVIIVLIYGLNVMNTKTVPAESVSLQASLDFLAGVPLIGTALTSILTGIGTFFIGLAIYKHSTLFIVLAIIVSLIYLMKMFKK